MQFTLHKYIRIAQSYDEPEKIVLTPFLFPWENQHEFDPTLMYIASCLVNVDFDLSQLNSLELKVKTLERQKAQIVDRASKQLEEIEHHIRELLTSPQKT